MIAGPVGWMLPWNASPTLEVSWRTRRKFRIATTITATASNWRTRRIMVPNQAAAGAAGGCFDIGWWNARRLRDRILRQVALHRGLAREVDPTLSVDLGHDDHDLVADGDDVLDRRDVVVGQLADANEAF